MKRDTYIGANGIGYGLILCAISVFIFGIYSYNTELLRIDFINSDMLYLSILDEFGPTQFKTPPSTYFFPDFIIYKLATVFTINKYAATIYAGYIQLLLIGATLTICCGGVPAAISLGLCMFLSFEDMLLVSNHISIPLLVATLLYRKIERNIFLIPLLVLADPFLIIPITTYVIVAKLQGTKLTLTYIALTISWLFAWVFGEFNKQLVMPLPIILFCGALLPIPLQKISWLKAIKTADRKKTTGVAIMAIAVLLLAIEQPMRYVNALILTATLFYFWNPKFSKQKAVGLVALMITLICAILTNNSKIEAKLDGVADQYNCLWRYLDQNNIITYGVDYWNSKPLYIASNSKSKPIIVDYELWETFPWISPLAWGQGTTNYFIQSSSCTGTDKHCNKSTITEYIKSKDVVCKNFIVYELNQSFTFTGPQTKSESIKSNLYRNLKKTEKKLF